MANNNIYQITLKNDHPKLKLQNFLMPDYTKEKNKSEAKNIADQTIPLKPLYFIMRLVSIDPSETNLILRRSRGVLLTAFLLYASYWSIVDRFKYVYIHISNVVLITDMFGMISYGVVCIYNILTVSFSKIDSCNNAKLKCAIIDNLLGVDGCVLRKIQKEWILKFVVIMIIIVIATSAYDFIAWTTSYDTDHSIPYIINYYFNFVNALAICYFVVQLKMLWGRFYILNGHLETYSEMISKHNHMKCQETSGIMSWVVSIDKYSKVSHESFKMFGCSIDNLMKVYLLACDLADIYNSYFGVQILLSALSSIVSILRSLRVTAMFFQGEAGLSSDASSINPLVTTIMSSIFAIVILFLIICSCDFTTSEAKRTSLILDTILYNTCMESSSDSQKLEAWSQLMVRRSPQFTACKLFPIDYQLLVTIVGTVVTYFIIIVQIK